MEKTTTACLVGGDDPDSFLLLPEEVLIQILVHLPVVSLLRFKSVCKSWRDLIQTSFFIDLHTSNSSSSSSSKLGGSFILHVFHLHSMVSEILMLSSESGSGSASGSEYGDWYWGTDGGGGDWVWDNNNNNCGCYCIWDGGDWVWDDTNCGCYWISDDDKEDESDDELVLKLDSLGLPPSCDKLFSYKEVIVGSCNGLICLHDSERSDVSLWNPATRQFRILPKSITIQEKGFYDFVGFGFDVKTKDYKVLLITCFDTTSGPECICRVQVYSLSSDSWRLLEGIYSLPAQPIHEHHERHGIYLNGSYFFVGRKILSELPSYYYDEEQRNNCRLMISFDFTKEIFTTMQFPLDHDDVVQRRLYLSCLGEKLALFATTKSSLGPGGDQSPTSSYEDYDIWVWNEQGGSSSSSSVDKEESWTKLHSFQIKNNRGGGGGAWGYTLPRGISNNGEFALIETRCNRALKKKMQLFNLVTKEAKMDFLICDSVLQTDVYKQSLVSIISGNDASTTSTRPDRVIGGGAV